MLLRIKQWLAPPVFLGDEEKTTQARMINTIGLYFALALIVGAVVLVPLFVKYKMVSWAIILALAIVYGVSRFFLFRGRLVLCVVSMIAAVWIVGVGVTVLGGGIASPMLYVVLAATIFMGFLLELRIGTGVVFVSILAALGLALLQRNGMSPPQVFVFSPMATWFMFTLALSFIYAVMRLIAQNFQRALTQARQQNAARLQTEAILRESEERLRMTIELSPIGVGIVDDTGNLINCNTALAEMVGYASEELLQLNFVDFTHPDDLEQEWSLINELRQEKRNHYRIEKRYVHQDGHTIWADVVSSLFKDETGKIKFAFAFVQDITERKRTEQALRQALNIVENVQIGLYIYHLEDIDNDRTLRMVYANPASEKFTGLRAIDIVGKTLDENFPNLRQLGIPQRYAEVVRTQTPCELGDVLYGDERVRMATFSVKVFPLPDQHMGASFEDITARKQAEDALHQSNEFLQSVLQNTPSSIFVRDLEGRYLLVNRQYQQVIGITAEQAFGKHPKELHRSRAAEQIIRNDLRVLESGMPLESEEIVLVADEPRTFIATKALLRDAAGQPYAFCTVGTDITERVRAEEALRQQAQIIDQIHDSVIATDIDGFITTWNHGSERLFGFTAEQAIGQHVSVVYPQESHDFLRDELIPDLKVSGALDMELRLQKHTGERFDAHVSLSLMHNNARDITGMIGYTLDISERKQAEEALRENQRFIESVISATPDIVHIYDLQERRTIYSSRSILDGLGYTSEEIAAMGDDPMLQLLHPDDIEQLPALFGRWDTVKDGELLTAEYRMRTRHGEWRWFLGRDIVFQRGADGRVQQFIGTIQDTTMRKQMEQTLQRYTNRLATLHVLDQAILAAESPEATVQAALDHLWNLVPCEYAWVIGVDLREGMDYYISGQARDGTALQRKPNIPILDSYIEMIRQHSFYVFYDAVGFVYDGLVSRLMREQGVRTVVFFRLMARGQILGLLVLAFTTKIELSNEEIEAIVEVADSLAVALHQAQMRAQIEEDARVKDHLLREVNHRVSNNLMAITGMLRTERRYALPDYAQVIDVTLTRLIRRVEGLAEVHRLLSQSQWRPINLDQLASHIIHIALNALPPNQRVDVRITPSSITVSPRQASNLALILNELTTNTIKYAMLQSGMPGGDDLTDKKGVRARGHIEVCIAETEDGMVMLDYRDDGPGYPEPALHFEDVDVGLYLIEQLALTLQGKVTLSNDDGAVTTLIFEPEEKDRT